MYLKHLIPFKGSLPKDEVDRVLSATCEEILIGNS